MNHNEVKELLLKNPDVKREYDALAPIYEIQKEIIQSRIEQGLSQKDLANKVGTRQSAISRLENGSYNPSIAFLSKVAYALGKQIHIKMQ